MELSDAADVMDMLDIRADARGAKAILSTAEILVQHVNAGPHDSEPIRNCQLAAAHLLNGALPVAEGDSWYTRIAFENALAE